MSIREPLPEVYVAPKLATTYEVRITAEHLLENFVTPDFSAAYDKMDEWEADPWNASFQITLYEWQNGERIALETRTVY
jgi:hypothetical protein